MRTIMAVAVLGLAVASCGDAPEEEVETDTAVQDDMAAPEMQQAQLMDADGNSVGTVEYRDDGTNLTLMVQASGLAEGPHAVHLHETGMCKGPEFQSAGGHWNPEGNQHGRDNPEGAHLGDLANMTVGADGMGQSNFIVEGVGVSSGRYSLSDSDGTALMIHAEADDYQTDPGGDAGSRVACAVLAAPSGGGMNGQTGMSGNDDGASSAMDATTGGNSMEPTTN
ncbi:superoxide dismutase family protein [Sphingomicrobium sp. XHP0239]|uniref:superoxide dismutase family protein n=1 Tax=Sphingomicrobium maritimum TaxID=3133972 RepID=UPI0031CCAC04